ncbi:phosphohistidine phosphatase [Poriferisphaera corsica]|uniref:Phosphohistidine phosphatase n=1 Tax=Poriferisphaera corsica TaxID=2528020 RepID=A0A517YQE8_9BACT|nr:histidine phosphatase family protein [Poriferisphaera corsica]QDU32445.1 phosphohistidine phosphatase [Poriferisphaera corsica]
MRLLLFRHGIAEPGTTNQPDDLRPLTPLGLTRSALAAQGLSRFIDRPQAILTSSKTRAAQTAAFIGDTFDLAPEFCDPLTNGPTKKIIKFLQARPENDILIVGHEPYLSELISILCFPKARSNAVELKKASCALIEAPIRKNEPALPSTSGILHWILPPRALRQLAGET